MLTSLYKPMKKNGTSMYVFPSVAEDKNFENTNDNYKMSISHFVLVNFPKQNLALNFEDTFDQNGGSIPPIKFKDALVESLRNYVANHETVIRNSKINNNTYYYDTFEKSTTTEKIFWKWAKKLKLIEFELANPAQDYNGADTKYNNTTTSPNHYKQYLWKEKTSPIYDVINVVDTVSGTTIPAVLPVPTLGTQFYEIQFSTSTNYVPDDYILLSIEGIDPIPNYSLTQSSLKIVGIKTTTLTNDTVIVEVDAALVGTGSFGVITDLEAYNKYERFIKYIGEIAGENNVQLPDKSYKETFANISYQHGLTPYILFSTNADNNYKPNSIYPILNSEIQTEIQGGELVNNPIIINPNEYPGDVYGHFDNSSFQYTTESGDISRRYGNYYGNHNTTSASINLYYNPTNAFDPATIDGLKINLDINDYLQATSYVYPLESFNEFASTSFNNSPPADFEFNAILWYYTIEDTTGNTTTYATNLYGVEFLDTPDNDLVFDQLKIPSINKYVSNGYQDGNAFTWTLDLNYLINNDVTPPSYDPDKVYTLFGMELFYEALTRLTYFNDQVTTLVNSNISLTQKVNNLTGLVYNQQELESVRTTLQNLQALLVSYSTLQIGNSDTIESYFDNSVTPPVIRLRSVDKKYGFLYSYNTKDLYTEFTNVNSFTDIAINEKNIPVVSGKDFLSIVINNDNSVPTPIYDTTKVLSTLSLVIDKDLNYLQTMDMLILPKFNQAYNDKKIDLYINYTDNLNALTKYKIGTYNLPVLKYTNGSVDEPYSNITNVPVWDVKHIFYSKPSTTQREFSFIVESDNMPIGSHFIIDNFIIKTDPTLVNNNYTNLSSQYAVYNIENINTNVTNVEIINKGTGYTNNTFVDKIPHIISGSPLYNTTLYGHSVKLSTNGSGELTAVTLVRNDLAPITSDAFDLATSLPGVGYVAPAGSGGQIKFIVKSLYRIKIIFDVSVDATLNTLFTKYDTATGINTLALNTPRNIDTYAKLMPEISYLKGYKLSLTRISESNLPISSFNEKYNIKIERL